MKTRENVQRFSTKKLLKGNLLANWKITLKTNIKRFFVKSAKNRFSITHCMKLSTVFVLFFS